METEILTGTIDFRQVNKGTKSECLKPFLVIDEQNYIQLYMQNDNPFENNLLTQYRGKKVEIKGYRKENLYVVTEVKEI